MKVLLFIVPFALMVYALIDLYQTDPAYITSLKRPIWLAIVVLLPVVGPILWLTVAKRDWQARPARPSTPPVAPDDNPEFLRQLKSLDEEHEQMLDKWESDLRKREEEMRRRGEGNGDDDSHS